MKFLVVFIIVLFSGCSFVAPHDAVIIDESYKNAVEFNKRIQELPSDASLEPNIPSWLKTWLSEDVKSWHALSSWANGKSSR